jgi:hypothetical protein
MKRQDRLVVGTAVPTIALSAAFAIANSHSQQAAATAAVALVCLYIRVSWQVPMSQTRAKRLLEAAAKNPEISFVDVMAAQRIFPEPSPEVVEAEVRARLRDIAEAIDPAVVEPLWRVTQWRLAGQLSRERAAAFAAFIKPLTATQRTFLEAFLKEVLAALDADDHELPFISWVKADGSRGLGVEIGDNRIAMPDSRSSIFNLLQVTGLGLAEPIWSGPGAFVSDGSDAPDEPKDRLNVDRSTVVDLLALIRTHRS